MMLVKTSWQLEKSIQAQDKLRASLIIGTKYKLGSSVCKHMGPEHASREKKLPMVIFFIFIFHFHKNVYRIIEKIGPLPVPETKI